jgi:hypothetical protein
LGGANPLTAKIGSCNYKAHVEFEFETNTTSSTYDRNDAGTTKLSVVNASNDNSNFSYECGVMGVGIPIFFTKNTDNTLDI